MQLRLAYDQTLRGGYVREHLREKILNELERADRFSELETLLRILDRSLKCAHRASSRHPGNGVARQLQHFRGVAERVAALETIFFRHAAIFHSDVAVLHDLERNLVLNLVHAKPRCGLVFNDETFDLIVVDVARPDDRDVAPGRIADPALLTVKNPGIAVALRRR